MKQIPAAGRRRSWRSLAGSASTCRIRRWSASSPQVHAWPITREIAHASTRLDVRGDPAAELIAATSLAYDVPLVTRDAALLRSKPIPFAR